MTKATLLVVEDDQALCIQYRWALQEYRTVVASNRPEAERAAAREQPSCVLLDLGLPPDPEGVEEGFATLEALRRSSPTLPIIVATGRSEKPHALRALSLGAHDFIEKPVDPDVLRVILDRVQRISALEEENRRLSVAVRHSPIRDIITADPEMLKICRTVERLAPVSVPVLLLGESGTGKEALARALHDMSPRSSGTFVALNCAAIPEPLLEAELFGHEKGAFTGAVKQTMGRIEMADGGTLFLDEIGEMPISIQAKLLRFLQDQVFERIGGRRPMRVDVRVVSATNRPLDADAAEGRFRGDLFYRLNAVTVRIPPLRERSGDALLLARWFLARYADEFKRKLRGLDPSACDAIERHAWPGNVRELDNRIRRAVLMADGPIITAADLELAAATADDDLDLRATRQRAEHQVIQRALARSNNSLTAAAKLLGVSRPTLYDLLQAHGLTVDRSAAPGTEPGTVDPSSNSAA